MIMHLLKSIVAVVKAHKEYAFERRTSPAHLGLDPGKDRKKFIFVTISEEIDLCTRSENVFCRHTACYLVH